MRRACERRVETHRVRWIPPQFLGEQGLFYGQQGWTKNKWKRRKKEKVENEYRHVRNGKII